MCANAHACAFSDTAGSSYSGTAPVAFFNKQGTAILSREPLVRRRFRKNYMSGKKSVGYG
jgi:hypothetical protein